MPRAKQGSEEGTPNKRPRRRFVKINPLTEEEAKDLALRYMRKEIYIASNEEDLISFQFIMMMWFEKVTKKTLEQIGAFWEDYTKAAPRAINGRPMFFSMHIIHKDSMPMLREKIRGVQEALDAV